jgi:hypothetical protein
MQERKKSRKSGSTRDALRILLAIIPLPAALSLMLFPELGEFSLMPLLGVFLFGLAIGTFINIYWLRTSLKEIEFYKKYYNEVVMKPHKNDLALYKKHAAILLPFWIFAILMVIIVFFVFGIFKTDAHNLLPLMLGVVDGMPVSYWLMMKRLV